MDYYDSDDDAYGAYNSSEDENYRTYNHRSDDEEEDTRNVYVPSIPSEYQYADPESEFQNEYNYQERVGGYLDNNALVGLHRKGKQSFDAPQRFANLVTSVAMEMADTNILPIRSEIPTLLSFIQDFKHTRYKNPTAFILGFWVTKDTKTRINETALNHVKRKLRLLTYPVRDYDVIRYANLWMLTIWDRDEI